MPLPWCCCYSHHTLPLQVCPVCDLWRFPDATPGAVRPVAVPKPSGLFHLTANRENGLHHFHGHLIIHLHAPQHGRASISCWQGCHEVEVLISQSGEWLTCYSLHCHFLFETIICVVLSIVHLKPFNYSFFYSRKMCSHKENNSHGNFSKERIQNTTNQKLLVSAWASSPSQRLFTLLFSMVSYSTKLLWYFS